MAGKGRAAVRVGMVVGLRYGGKPNRPAIVLHVDDAAGVAIVIFATGAPARTRRCIRVEKNGAEGRILKLSKASNFCREELATVAIATIERDGVREGWGWCPDLLLAELQALAGEVPGR